MVVVIGSQITNKIIYHLKLYICQIIHIYLFINPYYKGTKISKKQPTYNDLIKYTSLKTKKPPIFL